MLEQVSNSVTFTAFFVANKVGKTGLTVTVDVYNPAGSLIVDGVSATEIGGGFYEYTLASGSVSSAGEYKAVFKTTNSDVDQQHLPALWVIARAGIEYLDQALSTTESSIRGTDDDTLKTLSDQIDDIPTTGAGATEETLMVEDGDSNPLDGAEVWVTTDEGGSNLVASGITDALGEVTFYLDAGDYYVWVQLSGYNFTNPTEITVS